MMPGYATGTQIAIGDWVRVIAPRQGVWHHGIVRRIYWAGTGFAVEIAHNKKGFGVIKSDWYEFAEGQTIFLHRRPSPETVQSILARVESNMGKPYHLFANNCEHFASFAFAGKSESRSVKVLGWLAAAAVIIGFLGME